MMPPKTKRRKTDSPTVPKTGQRRRRRGKKAGAGKEKKDKKTVDPLSAAVNDPGRSLSSDSSDVQSASSSTVDDVPEGQADVEMEVTENEKLSLEQDTDRPVDHSSAAVDDPTNSADKKKKIQPDIDTGTTSYEFLRKLRQFVDQTEFIRVVMNVLDQVLFVGGPPRFGKSIKANMLALFFELLLDNNGEPLIFKKPSDSPNYKYFEGTKIAGYTDFVNKHFGKYPVIFLDFADVGDFSDVSTESQVYHNLIKIISEAFIAHEYLCNSERIRSTQRADYQKWCNSDLKGLTEENLKESLYLLVKCLAVHHGKQVFIIIDEVDAPCVTALFSEKKKARKLFSKIQSMLKNILDLVANNLPVKFRDQYKCEPYVKFYMTGISFTLTGLSAINNVKEIPFLRDARFTPYCGFNAADVADLCKKFEITETERKKITEKYNGLQFWETKSPEFQIYNPLAVLLHIESGTVAEFETPSYIHKMTDLLVEHGEVSWVIEHLLLGHTVEYSSETTIDEAELYELAKLVDKFWDSGKVDPSKKRASTNDSVTNYRVQHPSTQVLLMFLASIGCFTYVNVASDSHVGIELPNLTVREYFEKLFAIEFSKKRHRMLRKKIHAAIEIEVLIGLTKSNGDSKKIRDTLKKLETHFQEIINHEFNATGKAYSESIVKGVLCDILRKSTGIKVFNTEYSTKDKDGKQRYADIQIAVDNSIAVIIETKFNAIGSETNSEQIALSQAFRNGYTHHIETKYALALGCCISHISSVRGRQKFVCKFAGVGDETESLKKLEE